MKGPLTHLVGAGKKGAYSGNIQRDMLRCIRDVGGTDAVSWFQSISTHYFEIYIYFKKYILKKNIYI